MLRDVYLDKPLYPLLLVEVGFFNNSVNFIEIGNKGFALLGLDKVVKACNLN